MVTHPSRGGIASGMNRQDSVRFPANLKYW
jgi:hypothetical protein